MQGGPGTDSLVRAAAAWPARQGESGGASRCGSCAFGAKQCWMGLLARAGAVLRTDAARLGTVLRSPEAPAATPLAASSRTAARSLQLVHGCQSRAASGGLPRVPASGHQFNPEYKGQVRCEAECLPAQFVPSGSSMRLQLMRCDCCSLLTLQRLKLTGRKPPFLKVTAGSILLVRCDTTLHSPHSGCPRPQRIVARVTS